MGISRTSISGQPPAPIAATVEAGGPLMWARTTDRPTTLDPLAMRRLAEDTGPDVALRFLGDYLGMLPGRLDRILQALTEKDAKASLDALISLRTTSCMSGALDAAASCRELESLVRNGSFGRARMAALRLSPDVADLYCATPALLKQARDDLSSILSC